MNRELECGLKDHDVGMSKGWKKIKGLDEENRIDSMFSNHL
jgi:hypothetical protein